MSNVCATKYEIQTISDDPKTAYPYEQAVGVAGTPVGSLTAFTASVAVLTLVADKDIWFAKTSAGTTTTATGATGGRCFAMANERRVIPWASQAFFVVNSVTGELPSVRVEGWI